MSPAILLFVGAPEARSLDWDKPELLDNFSDPFTRFMGLGDSQDFTSLASTSSHPAWRSIPLERQHLPTGLSQNHAYQGEYRGASFFTTGDIESFIEERSQPQVGGSQVSSAESVVQVLSQFYEQSYAVHEEIPSSQLAPASNAGTSLQSDGSFSVTGSSFDSPWNSFSGTKEIPSAGFLTSLKDIPNAAYLNSIQPQTMTVNLIVGIISLPSPREIKTRRGDKVELIEVLVGDETKSGFGINFWLPSSQSADGELRSVLNGLRPQDVVLVKNVALSSFRNKVYGQSLRKNMTKAFLLYRSKIDKPDVGGCYSAADLVSTDTPRQQVEKTRRVREWVVKFVGEGPERGKGKGRMSEMIRETLPPDTQ